MTTKSPQPPDAEKKRSVEEKIVCSHYIGGNRIELEKNSNGKLRKFSLYVKKDFGNRLHLANFDTEEKGRIYMDGLVEGIKLN